ncbi:glycosyltransferase [Alteromonas sp. 1_MG-2023]|uniref:glycosyltransferase n=1 Tax=Alteromonas sp. 1_MG-2023 TaxID=3062669 RepID=UPI0026E285A7|nr:glycosyltransferase [Alteromonas sp. 1_MG-2023]MDO6566332.1 glycosyltransferase [Alteromonas sp. 1_MG-2023]
MKKILFVHSVGELGGAERMSLSLMEHLSKDDFTCVVTTPESGEFVEKSKNAGAIHFLHTATQPSLSTPIRTIKNALQWRHILFKVKPDIIHTADLLSTRSISGAAKSLNIPVIFHAHFPFSEDFANWALRKAPAKVVFCSQDLLNSHKAILAKCCPVTELKVIHNGVDTNKFSPSTVNNSVPKIGIVANLQERKGHKEFLEMAAMIKDAGVQAEFHIIGGDIMQGPRELLLKDMSSKLNISELVTFHGQVADVRLLVNSLDVLVCASYEEAFPVSILEAMAMKKAIVSTKVNGIPEAIVHSSSGMLVNPYSSSELCENVLKLLSNSQLKEKIASNALIRVKENFSVEAFVAEWVLCYHHL